MELLVLDDLGAQQSSAWSNEKLLQLIDARAKATLFTLITAIPKEFQGLDERLRLRLTDAQLVTTVLFEKARDFRPLKPALCDLTTSLSSPVTHMLSTNWL